MSQSPLERLTRKGLAHGRMALRRIKPRTPALAVEGNRRMVMGELEAVTLADGIDGWLHPPASILTLHLLGQVPFGPVVEIGVYLGKYLSILRAGMGETCRIVGYDIFDQAQAPLVERTLAGAFGTLGNVALFQLDSTTLTADRVREDCGGAPVFMSIDGSHEAGPVLSDMRLADAVLDAEGIVAMDDVLNPLALGVNEGVARYLSGPNPDLVPFAYAANKMFFCRADIHAARLEEATAYLDSRGDDPSFPVYAQMKRQNDPSRRAFFGVDVLIAAG